MADARQLRVGMPYQGAGTFNPATFALDQTTDQMEWVFQAPAAITITRLGFRYGVRTGTPPTYRVSLQGVGSTGNPDGTIKGGGSPASATFTPPASTAWNGLWQWVTLANPYACARGEFLAAVIDYSAGTVDASNNSAFTSHHSNAPAPIFPCAVQNNAGTRARQSSAPVFGYGSSSAAYGAPLQAANNQGVNTSTPLEAGLKFSLPSGWGSTFQVVGLRCMVLIGAGGRTLTAKLYQGGAAGDTGTVLQDVAFDTDFASGNAQRLLELYFDEAALATLSYGSAYRLSFAASDATAHTLTCVQQAAAADWDAYPGGQDFLLSTRGAGNWTDDATTRPLCELILADTAAAAQAAPADVRSGTVYGGGTGTLVVPAAGNVKSGVQYGAGGTEFTGTYAAAGGVSRARIVNAGGG